MILSLIPDPLIRSLNMRLLHVYQRVSKLQVTKTKVSFKKSLLQSSLFYLYTHRLVVLVAAISNQVTTSTTTPTADLRTIYLVEQVQVTIQLNSVQNSHHLTQSYSVLHDSCNIKRGYFFISIIYVDHNATPHENSHTKQLGVCVFEKDIP